jgi:leucyl/phenylalanyl-tRNA--protein transferase
VIALLSEHDTLPDARSALHYPNGLLAAGGSLRHEWLINAYRHGIFPWFGNDDPILWWSPDPRMVLATRDFRLRKSLRKRLQQWLRQGNVRIEVDRDFAAVIAACAAPRDGASGTWIVPAVQKAYCDLHELGHAHSFEVRVGGELVGGLYGVAIGRIFYGESMFTRIPDASKAALTALVGFMQAHDAPWIDCQQQTSHLASLGAQPIGRDRFLQGIAALTQQAPLDWAALVGCDLLPAIAVANIDP